MSNVIPFRLSRNGSDKDIEEALTNVQDRTKRIKQLLRLGIEYEALKRLKRTSFLPTFDEAPQQSAKPSSLEGISIKVNGKDLVGNILSGFD